MNSNLLRYNCVKLWLICTIPYLYHAETRLKGKAAKLGWVFTYYLPVTSLFFLFINFTQRHLLLFLLGITIINYIYENGYIENDVSTIKREVNPTLRLSVNEQHYLSKHYGLIFFARFFIVAILLGIYMSINMKAGINMIGISAALQLLYLIYNRTRSLINLLIIPVFNQIRFVGALYPFIASTFVEHFTLYTLPIYPLLKLIEFSTRERFGLEKLRVWIGDMDRFRPWYYFFFCILYGSIGVLWADQVAIRVLILLLFFFIYRVLIYIYYMKYSNQSLIKHRGKQQL